MVLAAVTTTARIEIIVGAGLVLWQALAAMAAGYGRGKSYPFFPLFVAAVFLGFPIVLLAVAIGAGPRSRTPERPSYEEMPILASSMRGVPTEAREER